MSLLRVLGLAKCYGESTVFADATLTLQAGEFVALLGESGVGKSTLLHAIAGLDSVDAGQVWLDGVNVTALTEPEQALLRRRQLGFVFQAFHVLPHLSVADNVGLPLMLLGQTRVQAAARVQEMLEAVGLGGLGARLPQQLSGGQLQRVAIARALVHRPRLILADEPTGNLDPATANTVLDAMTRELKREGAACLLVTHSAAAAARADRVLRLTAQGIVTVSDTEPRAAGYETRAPR